MPYVGRLQIWFDPEVIVPALILPDPTVNVLAPIVFYNVHPSTLRVIVKRSYPESATVADRYISANARDVFIDTVPFQREQIVTMMSGGEAVVGITYDVEVYEYNTATGAYDKTVGIATINVSFRFIDPASWSGTVVEHPAVCRSGSRVNLSTTEFGETVGTCADNLDQVTDAGTVLVPPHSCALGAYVTELDMKQCFKYTISNLPGARCYLILYFRRNRAFSIYVADTGRGLPGFVTATLPTTSWYGVGLKLRIPSSDVYVCPTESVGAGVAVLWYDEWWVVCK